MADFIDGVHNYCDRWCERCEFTARCRVFAMEAEMLDEEKDVGSEAFVRNLANILEDAKRMLAEKAEEFGIDLNAIDDQEIADISERKQEFVEQSELTKLAERYAFEAGPLLEESGAWASSTDVDLSIVHEVLAVLHWYRFFIAAKIERGLHGIADDGREFDQLSDPQGDANGSVKIALIAIERSILAWTYLLDENNADRIRPFIQLLELIKRKTEEKFPYARDFVRPGFDEIDTVM